MNPSVVDYEQFLKATIEARKDRVDQLKKIIDELCGQLRYHASLYSPESAQILLNRIALHELLNTQQFGAIQSLCQIIDDCIPTCCEHAKKTLSSQTAVLDKLIKQQEKSIEILCGQLNQYAALSAPQSGIRLMPFGCDPTRLEAYPCDSASPTPQELAQGMAELTQLLADGAASPALTFTKGQI